MEIDATDESSIKEGIRKTVEKFGGLHGAINCAGIGSASLTLDKRGRTHNAGIFDFVMKLNTYGVFYASAHAAAAMSKVEPDEDNQRGVIINVSSVAGLEGQKGQLAYSASKGAVIGMTLPMARDLVRPRVAGLVRLLPYPSRSSPRSLPPFTTGSIWHPRHDDLSGNHRYASDGHGLG